MNEREEDRPTRWVTIARYFSTTDALFFKNVLEGHGIPAFIRGEYMGQLFPHLTLPGVSGTVELQVPEEWETDARTLLETGAEDIEGDELSPEEMEEGQEQS